MQRHHSRRPPGVTDLVPKKTVVMVPPLEPKKTIVYLILRRESFLVVGVTRVVLGIYYGMLSPNSCMHRRRFQAAPYNLVSPPHVICSPDLQSLLSTCAVCLQLQSFVSQGYQAQVPLPWHKSPMQPLSRIYGILLRSVFHHSSPHAVAVASLGLAPQGSSVTARLQRPLTTDDRGRQYPCACAVYQVGLRTSSRQ